MRKLALFEKSVYVNFVSCGSRKVMTNENIKSSTQTLHVLLALCLCLRTKVGANLLQHARFRKGQLMLDVFYLMACVSLYPQNVVTLAPVYIPSRTNM